MDKCRLELVGITYNQIESGVYAVILKQADGTRRIPIVIGYPEAQAIECKLQEVITPRPLTHDIMVSSLFAFGVSLKEVNIYRLPNGVFAAEITLERDGEIRKIDSRSSDAIALAIRVGAPIYTTSQLLEEAGFEPGERKENRKEPNKRAVGSQQKNNTKDDITLKSLKDLEAEMKKAAENENYEEAARIKAEIDRRKK